MNRFWTMIPAVGLAAGLGLSMALADGQPPAGEKKDPPPRDRGGFPGGPPPGGRPGGERAPEPKPDPAVEAWVKTLADKMTDTHDVIRESARAGLVAAGPAAVPTLRKLADGDDGAKATAARRVLHAIEHGPRPGMAGGPPIPRNGGAPAPGGNRRPDGPPDDRRPDGDRRPMNDLGLNEKQQKQMEAVQQAAQRKLREVRERVESNDLDPADARKKAEAIRDALLKEAKEVLTPEQFEKFQERMPTPGRRPMDQKD